MNPIKAESKMIAEVRRWRKEVYEERSRQTLEGQIASDKALIESLGLKRLLEPKPPVRKAG
jgi:hypothetical protein